MAFPEDNVPISTASPTATPAAPTLIKTFSAIDTSGNRVEIQAIVLTTEYGRTVDPMTEATGREIVEWLRSINNILADYTGCGQNLPASAPSV